MLIAHDAACAADQDRRQGGPARSVRHDPACRGGSSAAAVRGNPVTEASTDMTPCIIAAYHRRKRILGICRMTVFPHPIASRRGLGRTERPIPRPGPGYRITLSIKTQACYRLPWLRAIIWEIPVHMSEAIGHDHPRQTRNLVVVKPCGVNPHRNPCGARPGRAGPPARRRGGEP